MQVDDALECKRFWICGAWIGLGSHFRVVVCALLGVAMGFEKGGSYGTFDGQQGFPQPSAPPLAGTFGSGGQQYPVVQGMLFLPNFSFSRYSCIRF